MLGTLEKAAQRLQYIPYVTYSSGAQTHIYLRAAVTVCVCLVAHNVQGRRGQSLEYGAWLNVKDAAVARRGPVPFS